MRIKLSAAYGVANEILVDGKHVSADIAGDGAALVFTGEDGEDLGVIEASQMIEIGPDGTWLCDELGTVSFVMHRAMARDDVLAYCRSHGFDESGPFEDGTRASTSLSRNVKQTDRSERRP